MVLGGTLLPVEPDTGSLRAIGRDPVSLGLSVDPSAVIQGNQESIAIEVQIEHVQPGRERGPRAPRGYFDDGMRETIRNKKISGVVENQPVRLDACGKNRFRAGRREFQDSRRGSAALVDEKFSGLVEGKMIGGADQSAREGDRRSIPRAIFENGAIGCIHLIEIASSAADIARQK